MKTIVFILTLILAITVSAQIVEPDITIRDFSGGLNTRMSPFQLRPNQSQECYNWDLSAMIGALSKRRGYVALTDSMVWNEPLIGIFGYISRNGSKRLFSVSGLDTCGDYYCDSLYLGLGQFRVSDEFQYDGDPNSNGIQLLPDSSNFVNRYVYAGATPRWTIWRNNVILSNGRQTPLIWTEGNVVRDLIPVAPGGLIITPINRTPTTGTGLNGTYRYVYGYQTDCGTYWPASEIYTQGVVSDPIKLNKEMTLISHFPRHTIDFTCAYEGGGWNAIDICVYRTKANPETFYTEDTLWAVKHATNRNFAFLDTFQYIDSIPDESLGAGSYTDYAIPNFTKGTISDVGVCVKIRPGAPTYVGHNTCTGIQPKADTGYYTEYIGYAYAMAYMDTLTGIISDTGRSLIKYFHSSDSGYKIGLPPVPYGMTHLDRILFRADVKTNLSYGEMGNIFIGYTLCDSIYRCYKDGVEVPWQWQRVVHLDSCRWEYTYIDVYARDTTISLFKQLAIIDDPADSVYVDSVQWQYMYNRIPIKDMIPLSNLKGLTVFDNRLWGYMGSTLRYSEIGDWGNWPYSHAINLGLGDGDEGTAIVPARDYLAFYKNNSRYLIIPNPNWLGSYDDGVPYIRKWVNSGIGCIAPNSMMHYKDGLVYLSMDGVIHEKGSQFNARISGFDTISVQINDLLKYSPDDKSKAIGAIADDKYYLSFPEKDTTYVYDFLVGGWSIYNYAFEQVTFYDTVHTEGMTPSADMLFIDGESDLIYKADTTASDNGNHINVRWRSSVIGISAHDYAVDKFGLWRISNVSDTTGDVVTVQIYDAMDNIVNSVEVDTLRKRYTIHGLPATTSNYYSFGITDQPELLMDGGFRDQQNKSINDNWTKDRSDWNLSNSGYANAVGRAGYVNLCQKIIDTTNLDFGDSVWVQYTVSDIAGSFRNNHFSVWVGGGQGESDSEERTYVDTIWIDTTIGDGADSLRFRGLWESIYKVDNISAYKWENGAITGSQLITNGDFTTDANWTSDSLWIISSGKANKIASADFSHMDQFFDCTVGDSMILYYEITDYCYGGYNFLIGGAIDSAGVNFGADTVYDTIITGSGLKSLRIRKTPNAVFKLDTISVKKIGSVDSLIILGIDAWLRIIGYGGDFEY